MYDPEFYKLNDEDKKTYVQQYRHSFNVFIGVMLGLVAVAVVMVMV